MMGCRWIIPLCAATLVFAFAGCKDSSRRGEVWSSYDYLDPVPVDSGLNVAPSNRVVPYNQQVYDNDNTYVIPYGSMLCNADGNIQECY